jgi:hypothetical protein
MLRAFAPEGVDRMLRHASAFLPPYGGLGMVWTSELLYFTTISLSQSNFT